MWTYESNGGHPDDGFYLISPADRKVGLIDSEADAKEITSMLNEALAARQGKST